MVSSRSVLVKSVLTSRLPMKSLSACCGISSAKANESFTVNSLNLIEESLGTKNFESLSLGISVAESIGNGEKKSVMAFQSLYKNPGLILTALILSYCSVHRLPDF